MYIQEQIRVAIKCILEYIKLNNLTVLSLREDFIVLELKNKYIEFENSIQESIGIILDCICTLDQVEFNGLKFKTIKGLYEINSSNFIHGHMIISDDDISKLFSLIHGEAHRNITCARKLYNSFNKLQAPGCGIYIADFDQSYNDHISKCKGLGCTPVINNQPNQPNQPQEQTQQKEAQEAQEAQQAQQAYLPIKPLQTIIYNINITDSIVNSNCIYKNTNATPTKDTNENSKRKRSENINDPTDVNSESVVTPTPLLESLDQNEETSENIEMTGVKIGRDIQDEQNEETTNEFNDDGEDDQDDFNSEEDDQLVSNLEHTPQRNRSISRLNLDVQMDEEQIETDISIKFNSKQIQTQIHSDPTFISRENGTTIILKKQKVENSFIKLQLNID